MMQSEIYKKLISLNVGYEELVREPDTVQWRLVFAFGLTPASMFSDYPSFVPESAFEMTKGERAYGKRPIETTRIEKDPELYKKICPPELVAAFEHCVEGLSEGRSMPCRFFNRKRDLPAG